MSHMSRRGFYDIDQSATFESGQENFIRYRADLKFVHGSPKRASDLSTARLSGPWTNRIARCTREAVC